MSVIVTGCGGPKSKKILSFFFDGVDDNQIGYDSTMIDSNLLSTGNKKAVERQKTLDSIMAKNEYEMHPPYAEGECSSCHNVSNKKNSTSKGSSMSFIPSGEGSLSGWLVLPVEELCLQCHTDKSLEYAEENNLNIHEPVASGECTICHHPHRSKYKPLLLAEKARTLCLSCHDEEIPQGAGDHPELEASDDCIECHNPHLSSEEFFLE
ncbi:MAG: cytochrome c3 family protein [Candidatus Zixiibacteriota bacterium]